MSEENLIVTWAVELTGDRGALIEWCQLFDDLKSTHVEVRDEGGDRFYLRSERFDGRRETEIHRLGAELVRKMSSVMEATGLGKALASGTVVAIRGDGSRSPVAEVGTLPGAAVVATAGNLAPKTAIRAKIERWLELAEGDENISDAITFLARGGWFDLYWACEVMTKEFGTEHEMMKISWARRNHVKLVKENANLYRHARPGHLPSRFLSLKEARDLLRAAVQGWLDERDASASGRT
jgi:hypothetical protein